MQLQGCLGENEMIVYQVLNKDGNDSGNDLHMAISEEEWQAQQWKKIVEDEAPEAGPFKILMRNLNPFLK